MLETIADLELELAALYAEGAADKPEAASRFYCPEAGQWLSTFSPAAFRAWEARAQARVTRKRELRVKLGKLATTTHELIARF